MRFFRSSPIGTAAAILLIVAVVVAIFAGQVAPYDPLYNDYACGAIAQIQHLPHLPELCPAARARDAHTQWDAAAQRTADRGSSRSRRKSPSTVMASALVASARPGSVASHHAVVR